MVRSFDLRTDNGTMDQEGEEIFFNFTAIPGEGYRTIRSGTSVRFEIVGNKTGLTAKNIQVTEW